MNKEEIKKALSSAMTRTLSDEGVTETLSLDKMADIVIQVAQSLPAYSDGGVQGLSEFIQKELYKFDEETGQWSEYRERKSLGYGDDGIEYVPVIFSDIVSKYNQSLNTKK